MSTSCEAITKQFESIGLTSTKAKETAENKKLCPLLVQAIEAGNVVNGTDPKEGALLYMLASTIKNSVAHLSLIAKKITDKQITTQDQVTAAIKFCDKKSEIDIAEFDKYCGVGVVVTPEEIKAKVSEIMESKKVELEAKRYQMHGMLLGLCKKEILWADAVILKQEVESQLLQILGPKDERDDPKMLKKKEKESVKSSGASTIRTIEELAQSEKFVLEGEMAKLHKPGENPQIKPELMTQHLKRTGGKVITRFPPEPNGFLHIGHAKAINVNFGYAKAHGGVTYLRYDDTNPEAEEEIYFTSILDTVRWLGFEPFKITYSSDHFQKLYELAIDLIKMDKAYVCFCTPEEMNADRGGAERGPRRECKHRNSPIDTSLLEFEKMKNGVYPEGIATLRMKMDMQHGNPQFWDLVAYRVLYTAHPRTGDTWCIYPTYDYTHCLVDSFEDITHSLCTTEFQLSRESYYWLVDALQVYKPVQWEYGRLSLNSTVLSKRKLNTLVTDGLVSGWDDPRIYTIASIRRRGFTPQAVNAFVRDLGVTTSLTTIGIDRLESFVRDHLNQIAHRRFLIQSPLIIEITNIGHDFKKEIDIPCKNGEIERSLVFSKQVVIDSVDFREESNEDFFRLAPGKSVGLLNVPGSITCANVVKSGGKVVKVECTYDESSRAKTYLQWLPTSAPKVQLRLYNPLFKSENPSAAPGGWLSDINPDSLETVHDAMVEPQVLDQQVGYTFQAVRVGYFCIDKDSSPDALVLNRTVSLKEDSKKT